VTYRPRLQKGDHTLSVQVKDAAGNFSDTTARVVNFKVETEAGLINVFNYPNPFPHDTYFTFSLVGSKLPVQLHIKIYSLAGRLIQDIVVTQGDVRLGFNRIPWNGRDPQGDEVANGVYFYKISFQVDNKGVETIQKLAKVR
jgi:flagellar hook assembly protein FlgD